MRRVVLPTFSNGIRPGIGYARRVIPVFLAQTTFFFIITRVIFPKNYPVSVVTVIIPKFEVVIDETTETNFRPGPRSVQKKKGN